MKRKVFNYIYIAFSIIAYLILSIILVKLVAHSGQYPSGSDTMYHVFRGESLLESIQTEGNWYPLLNYSWYNGVELMRYWAPLCAYIIALTQYIAGGALQGYLLFVGVVCFLCSIVWTFIGIKTNRRGLAFFIGMIWFFIPNNLYALFGEGNLPRALSMAFLPMYVCFLYCFLEKKKVKDLIGVTVAFVLMLLCHVGYAGMLALATLLFLVLHAITFRQIMHELRVVVAIILGFLVPGIWLIPSLITSKQSVDSSETMAGFFQSILISLNPLYRFQNIATFYFGLACFILAVFGMLLAKKKDRPGFVLAVITLFMTTSTMYDVIKLLPGSSYLWMLRFISIALAFVLFGFVNWASLKKPLVITFCVLLVLDCVPSYTLFYGDGKGQISDAEDMLNNHDDMWMIKKAKEITNQRIALLDEATLGSEGAYLVSAWGDHKDATLGAGWEAAETSSNIAQLNKAIAGGEYLYLFDRCFELGNDTVIFRNSRLIEGKSFDDLDSAAMAVGYNLVDANEGYRLYHMDVSDNWGLKSKYRAISIGTNSGTIARDFPCVEETTNTNLDDYSYEELSQYELVYLAGFTYHDKQAAEDLVLKLSLAGVKVIIAADGIPEGKRSHAQEFLGVICNAISFSQGYPLLDTIDGELDTNLFPEGHAEWNTVYVDGLDDVWGYVRDDTFKIPFYGTVKNENIVVIALNLTYYYSLTLDERVGGLLSHTMDLSSDELPSRQIVPIIINRNTRGMTIEVAEDNVNTCMAYHEIFSSQEDISSRNHMLMVNSGKTEIHFVMPHLLGGIVTSLVALMVSIAYFIYLRKIYEGKEEKSVTND